MKKSFKNALSLVVAFAVAASVMIGFSVSASAESMVVIADSCDDESTWQNFYHGSLELDTVDYLQGNGAISLDLPATGEGATREGPFASMTVVTFENYVDTTQYPYFEMFYKNSVQLGNTGIQVNFCDSDISASDGINHNNKITGSVPGWHRLQVDVNSRDPEPSVSSTDNGHITGLRVSWLSYENGMTYYECDWKYDGIIFYNQEFLDARTAEENRVEALIDAIDVPTTDNLAVVEPKILEAKAAIDAAEATYPNFCPYINIQYARTDDEALPVEYDENYGKWEEIYTAYMLLKKDDIVSAVKTAIDEIGDITAENYTEKLAAIEACEAKVADLNKYYDEYTLENEQVLADARDTYEDHVKAIPVLEEIKELIAPESITLENLSGAQKAFKSTNRKYDRLSDSQKAIVGDEAAQKLAAIDQKIYELEHPYVLGNVDESEDGKVTASDALLALQAAVKKIELNDVQAMAAEVDGKENITAGDALCILQFAVGKIDKFPIGNAE